VDLVTHEQAFAKIEKQIPHPAKTAGVRDDRLGGCTSAKSVLLIFPVAILGARLAGVVRQLKKLSVRIFAGLAIGTVVVFLAVGTILGFFATVVS